jgi:hypothetical protein
MPPLKKSYMAAVVVGLLLLVAGMLLRRRATEAFTSDGIPRCPTGYQFFNDRVGASFCCKGRVDPFRNTCMPDAGANTLCAFQPNTPNPRNPTGPVLPVCGALRTQLNGQNAAQFCANSLPNFADSGKCCRDPAAYGGADCTPEDLRDTERYCIVSATAALRPGERRCADVRLQDAAVCPSALKKIAYTLGEKENARYSGAAGLSIPLCFGIESSCIPDNAITELKSRGIYTDKNVATWKYSCGVWNRQNVTRDMTGTVDAAYV